MFRETVCVGTRARWVRATGQPEEKAGRAEGLLEGALLKPRAIWRLIDEGAFVAAIRQDSAICANGRGSEDETALILIQVELCDAQITPLRARSWRDRRSDTADKFAGLPLSSEAADDDQVFSEPA